MLYRFFSFIFSKAQLFVVVQLLFLTTLVPGQKNVEYSRQTLVYEQFADNSLDWMGVGLNDEQGETFINIDNACEIFAKQGYSMVIANEWVINTENDFDINCEIELVSQEANSLNSLVSLSWGCSFETMDQYSFSFSPSNLAVVRKLTSDVNEMVPSQKMEARGAKRYKISIQKRTEQYRFYLNQQIIGNAPFEPFFGDGILVTVGSGLRVRVHNFKIEYLTQKMNVHRLPRLAFDPPFQNSTKVETEDSDFTISGMAIDEDGISSLTINGVVIALENGAFSYYCKLVPGNNLIKLVLTDNSGQQQIKYVEVLRNMEPEKVVLGQKRLALVIGNSKYKHAAELRNTVKDAEDMAALLTDLDFEVMDYSNLDYKELVGAVREFGNKIHQYDVTLLFYAGHGIQLDGENYLIPIDAKLETKNDVAFEAVEVEKIIGVISQTDDDKLNLIILDACRNNPFRTWVRGGPEGLSVIQPPSGVLVAFATSPGSYASDGVGDNGLYTGELMKQLRISQRIEDVFINTRIAVEKKSGGTQSPWELARLRGKYYLK